MVMGIGTWRPAVASLLSVYYSFCTVQWAMCAQDGDQRGEQRDSCQVLAIIPSFSTVLNRGTIESGFEYFFHSFSPESEPFDFVQPLGGRDNVSFG